MADSDYIVVGSGINGLVCAAMLGLKGRKVLLLERNDRIGGCIRTEAVTAPGFVHDVMATTFVLFVTSPAYAVLGPELERVASPSRRPTSRPACSGPTAATSCSPAPARPTAPPSKPPEPATVRPSTARWSSSAPMRASSFPCSAGSSGRAPC